MGYTCVSMLLWFGLFASRPWLICVIPPHCGRYSERLISALEEANIRRWRTVVTATLITVLLHNTDCFTAHTLLHSTLLHITHSTLLLGTLHTTRRKHSWSAHCFTSVHIWSARGKRLYLVTLLLWQRIKSQISDRFCPTKNNLKCYVLWSIVCFLIQ